MRQREALRSLGERHEGYAIEEPLTRSDFQPRCPGSFGVSRHADKSFEDEITVSTMNWFTLTKDVARRMAVVARQPPCVMRGAPLSPDANHRRGSLGHGGC
jgi:hypothetical protein